MNYLLIAVKIICCSAVLYGYYRLFLQNRKFHRYNRFFLLSLPFFSLILPFINLPVFESTLPDPAVYYSLRAVTWGNFEEVAVIGDSTSILSLPILTGIIYFTGAITFLWFLMRAILYIRSIRKKYPLEQLQDLSFYNTNEPGTPFSFFKSVFWNEEIDLSSPSGKKIFRHELFHIRHYHSLDVLLCEVVCIIAWFNPFFHIIRKELKTIHEFLADEYAAGHSNQQAYAELLVGQAIQLRQMQLVHPFFQNHLKRRINMIIRFNHSQSGYWGRIMILPVAFILFCAISLYAQQSSFVQNNGISLTTSGQPFVLMIDAGHGGKDQGAKSADGKYAEKDLALAIAKKLRDKAEAAGIKVLMSRTTDESLTVQERANLSTTQKPDLFVSIHIAAGPQPVNNSIGGVEAYIGSKQQQTRMPSIELGNSILLAVKDLMKVSTPVKERSNAGIWVLDKAPCPAVLIHCGFMTNENDIEFISNEDNQQQLAARILSGILNYNRQKLTADQKESVQPEATTIAPTVNEIVTDDLVQSTLTQPEVYPSYPGGVMAWIHYLRKNLKYPEAAFKNNVSGTVTVKFIVDENGKVVHIGPVTGPEELKQEGIRIIRESGNWIPAMYNGQKVKSYNEQPIVFSLGK